MKNENQGDALLYIEVAAITNVSNQKLGTVQLNLFLRSKVDNNRKPIASQQVAMNKDKIITEELGLIVSGKEDFLEIEFQ